jgi:hypothetical protein
MTALNKKIEESNPYYDYAFKWINFAMKYNSALLDASSKAFETFLSARKGTAQNIEKTIRSSFDTTLRDDLNARISTIVELIVAGPGRSSMNPNLPIVPSFVIMISFNCN